MPPGSRVAVAELVGPKLAWFKNDMFVLTGMDALARERATVHASQTWLCKLEMPSKGALFKICTTYQEGVETPRHRVLNTGANLHASGIVVNTAAGSPALGRPSCKEWREAGATGLRDKLSASVGIVNRLGAKLRLLTPGLAEEAHRDWDARPAYHKAVPTYVDSESMTNGI